MSELVVARDVTALEALASEAEEYARRSRAPATLRAYATGWGQWTAFADEHGFDPLPADPAAVVLWITALARTHKPSTISRRLAALAAVHREHGHRSPTEVEAVRRVMAGINRTFGTRPAQKRALLVPELRRMILALPPTLAGRRDAAMLLVGYSGALRRGELASVRVEDLQFIDDSVIVTLPRSKTDQVGAGQVVAVPSGHGATCPVTAVRRWLEAADITTGAVFRAVDRHGNLGTRAISDRTVARVVQRAARAAGLDDIDGLAGHSLRAGLATSAALAGATEREIADQTRHRSLASAIGYVRIAEGLRHNVASRIDL